MSCSGENLNKQQNRYPLHFGKQMEFYLNIVSLKRKFQCLAVSRMNSSNTNCIFFFVVVAFMKFFMETPENLTVFPGPKKAPGKSGCFMATSANTP